MSQVIKSPPKNEYDSTIINPPATMIVSDARPILFTADGTPLLRKVGFSVKR